MFAVGGAGAQVEMVRQILAGLAGTSGPASPLDVLLRD